MPVPGGEDISGVETREQELSLAELTKNWTLGVGSDRSLGRPKAWNGEPNGCDEFAFKFSNWLSALPGDAERLLEESAQMGRPIVLATLEPREKVVARGAATAVRALVGGKALSCIRQEVQTCHSNEKSWIAGRSDGGSSSPVRSWFTRWLDLIGECEQARGRLTDDDIKVAVLLKRVPEELGDHLVLENPQKCLVM